MVRVPYRTPQSVLVLFSKLNFGSEQMTSNQNNPLDPIHLIEDEATGDRILLYGAEDGVRLELKYDGDTLWMTQAHMAELFGVDVRTVNEWPDGFFVPA